MAAVDRAPSPSPAPQSRREYQVVGCSWLLCLLVGSAPIFPGWRSRSICRAAAAASLSPRCSSASSARILSEPKCKGSPYLPQQHLFPCWACPSAGEDKWGGQAAAQPASAPAVSEAAANTRTLEQPLPPICAASSSAALLLPEPAFPALLGSGFHQCDYFFISLRDFSSAGKNTDFISSLFNHFSLPHPALSTW